MTQGELFDEGSNRSDSTGSSVKFPSKIDTCEEAIVSRVVEYLKGMPTLWATEANAQNAWDMLVSMWPENEPGLGIWDEIRSVLKGWISAFIKDEPLEVLRELWELRTEEGWEFDCIRGDAEERGEEAEYPLLDEIAVNLALSILDEVLLEAEQEGDRRRETEWMEWVDPRS